MNDSLHTANATKVRTEDGSFTLLHTATGEHYHSTHGAYRESMHVFVGLGLMPVVERLLANPLPSTLHLLEVGFGTGLNFLLTCDWLLQHAPTLDVHYYALEPYFVPPQLVEGMAYDTFLQNKDSWTNFIQAYTQASDAQAVWQYQASPNIQLRVVRQGLLDFQHPEASVDLIYYDAFSATSAPHMWDDASLGACARLLAPQATWVTYCIRGHIKRFFKAQGFLTEGLAGAPGKRQLLRVRQV